MKLLRRTKEIWKPIQDFPGYEVSNRGRVRSFWKRFPLGRGNGSKTIIVDTPQLIFKNQSDKKGYLVVILRKEMKSHLRSVHRLVLEAFIGLCPEGCETRHLDNNKGNPDLTNLCWGTKKENQKDRIGHGTDLRGEKHPSAKLTNEQAIQIKERLTKGESQTIISREYGVSKFIVWSIAHNKSYLINNRETL